LVAADVVVVTAANLNLSSLNTYITAVSATSITFTNVPYNLTIPGTEKVIELAVSFVVVDVTSPAAAFSNATKLLVDSKDATAVTLPNVEFVDTWNGFIDDAGELEVALLAYLNDAALALTGGDVVADDIEPVNADNLDLSSLNDYITAVTATSITFTLVPFTVRTVTTVADTVATIIVTFTVVHVTSPVAPFRAATYLLGLSDSSRVVNYKAADGLLNADDEINTPADVTLTEMLSKLFDLEVIPLVVTDSDLPTLLYYYFLNGIKYNVYGDITIIATYDTNTPVIIKVRPVVRREA
jgi:hypothetical protein